MKLYFTLILGSLFSLFSIAQEVNWAFGAGGSSTETIEAVETDAAGNTYIAGQFGSQDLDFDPGDGEFLDSPLGGYDIFVAKYDPQGEFLWMKSMEGSNFNTAYDIAIDEEGGVFVTGGFTGTVNFNTDGIQELTSGTFGDTFVVRFHANGDFDYVFSLSGEQSNSGHAIELDGDGNILLAGILSEVADFDPSTETVNILLDPGGFYLAKYTAEGDYIWAFGVPGNGGTDVKDIEIASNGDVVLTGLFDQVIDLDPGEGINTYDSDEVDSYILKVNASGEHQWGLVMTGNGNQITFGTGIDNDGSVYVCGYFVSEIDLDPTNGEEIVPSPTSATAFVSKLDADGNYLWGRTVPNLGDGRFFDVDIESETNDVFLTGFFNGTITLPDESEIFSVGGSDILSIRYDDSGNFLSHMIFGGFSNDQIKTGGVSEHDGNLTIGGSYYGMIDFGPGAEEFPGLQSNGQEDFFLVNYNLSTSIPVLEKRESLLYPNPTNGIVRMSETNNWSVAEVYDIQGKLLLNQSLMNLDFIDLSSLISGPYLIKLSDEKSNFSTQIILKK